MKTQIQMTIQTTTTVTKEDLKEIQIAKGQNQERVESDLLTMVMEIQTSLIPTHHQHSKSL
jgi:hypothetical protein